MNTTLTQLTDEVVFGEAPRWHRGRLWFSDIKGRVIKAVNLNGEVETILEVDFEPSGLGWKNDGRLLVVSMLDHRLFQYDGRELTELADLSTYCGGKLNDMVIDRHDNAFLSNLGFDYEQGDTPVTTNLLRVDADGVISIAAEGIWCPNGMAITQDGGTLIVGQSASNEVLAFDLADDGNLSRRRVYVTLPEGCIADGLCIDEQEAVWVASPITSEFLRLNKNGEITNQITTGDRHAIACMLGGNDRRTLFCMTSGSLSLSASADEVQGRVETIVVDIAGAGRP